MRTEDERVELFVEEIFPHIQKVVCSDILRKLSEMAFFQAPASHKYHGAYEGGLFDHSCNVLSALVKLTDNESLHWERPESPYIVGLFHDLCKCDSYVPVYDYEIETENGKSYSMYGRVLEGFKYNDAPLLKGHGDKSVMIASTLLSLTKEEVMCIRYHMGAFTSKEEWNDYTRAVHNYANVLWTHQADMIAAHIMEVDR